MAIAKAEEGRNHFRVEGRLTDVGDPRPRVEGVAKIEAASRFLVWMWTELGQG
jgi:hypothetical protein